MYGYTETVIGRLGTLNNLAYIVRPVVIKLLRDAARGCHGVGVCLDVRHTHVHTYLA